MANRELESQKTTVISEFDKYKTETTEIISLKTSKIDQLQLEMNSLKELSVKNDEDHAEEVETLAMKITSLEKKLEDNMNKSSSFEKAKEDLESELVATKAELQKSNEEHQLKVKQFAENELKLKKLEENITSLQATEALLITERSKMILELQSYKDLQERGNFVRPATPVKSSPQKENSVENQLSKSEMEELGIAEESNEDIPPSNSDIVLSDGDEESVGNVISQYEVVSTGVNTDACDIATSPSRDPVEVVSIGVNTDETEDNISPMNSESPEMEIASTELFTPPQMESQNAAPVQVEMVSIGVETDPVECVSMSVNTSVIESAPEIVSSGVNTSIMTSPEKRSPMNCSFGVNSSFQAAQNELLLWCQAAERFQAAKDPSRKVPSRKVPSSRKDDSENKVEQMQEKLDASRTTESQLLSKLEDLNKQLEESKTLASSLEDKNKILLGDNQTHLAAQLDFRSRVEELEVQIDQLKKSHQMNLEELQEEKSRLMKTLEELETQLQSLKIKMDEDKSELEKVNLNIAELQHQLSSTTNQRDAVSLELTELKGKI